MLDGIRTRNPQIRSLMRYPLRHEHLRASVHPAETVWTPNFTGTCHLHKDVKKRLCVTRK